MYMYMDVSVQVHLHQYLSGQVINMQQCHPTQCILHMHFHDTFIGQQGPNFFLPEYEGC